MHLFHIYFNFFVFKAKKVEKDLDRITVKLYNKVVCVF